MVARADDRDCAGAHQIARAFVAGLNLYSALGNLHRGAFIIDGNCKGRAFDHSGKIRRFDRKMRVFLLADVEDCLTPVLQNLDQGALFCGGRDTNAGVGPNRDEFLPANQNRVPCRASGHACTGPNSNAARCSPAACCICDRHRAARLAHRPWPRLRPRTCRAHQKYERAHPGNIGKRHLSGLRWVLLYDPFAKLYLPIHNKMLILLVNFIQTEG